MRRSDAQDHQLRLRIRGPWRHRRRARRQRPGPRPRRPRHGNQRRASPVAGPARGVGPVTATDQAPTIDEARVEAFVGTVLTNFGAAFAGILTGIGDKLGLFKDLAANGPATSNELA